MTAGLPRRRGRATARALADSRTNSRYGLLGSLLLAGFVLLLISGCTGQFPIEDRYETAKTTAPDGSEFNRHLYVGYLALAAAEREEFDWSDSSHFAEKALAAAGDQQVSPDAIYDRRLPPEAVSDLTQARRLLTGSLEKGARDRAPSDAALAQTSFDCWMQEQEEDHQPGDIGACQVGFYTALAAVQRKIGLPVTAAPAKLGDTFVVYFGIDSTTLTDQSIKTIMSAAAAKGAIDASKIVLSGHTDTLGPEDYNDDLSRQRVEAVKQLLLSAGVKVREIGATQYGEARPRIPTGDDQAMRQNRRVEINLIR